LKVYDVNRFLPAKAWSKYQFSKYTLYFHNNLSDISFYIKIKRFSLNVKNNIIYSKIENILKSKHIEIEYKKTDRFINNLPEEDQQEYIRIHKLERIMK